MNWLTTRRTFTLMIAPALLIYTVYMVYPILYSIYYSFTSYDGVSPATFTGLSNYREMMQDTVFRTSVQNTGIILGIAVTLLVPLAFLLAVLLSGNVKGSAILRPLVFAPAIVAPILVGLIWIFILDPKIGLVNALLQAVGIAIQPQWVGGSTLSPYSIAFVYLWQQIGFIVTILYAAIRMLPRDVMEASTLDGATRFQQLRYITVPMLRESFGICTALVVTGVFKIFELVYALTGGGPVHLSEVMVSYMYYVTFTTLQYSYGMALAVVVFVIGAVAAVVTLFGMKRRAAA
ncbi:carbohydrate ABC transporter permease [Streptomyces himalayensis]|uniref:Sugar ABC transporter permease n=2 Tax=Streptomyces himalayensis TaxID=2820085 RepID=A0A7W2D8C8_9ACTN|nr:sugar ABC transporter permease [Streptomyces himalayensis]MBA2950432.1 sugar ABC transporter permease [Streptomyces himalayensis subsp. himalayensis]MBA4866674.1 sugar ABC transporter permease [Streptomyces himalayensis subsp. aureolus]